MGAVGRHDEVVRRLIGGGVRWRRAQLQGDGGMGAQALQQQGHQRPVLSHPAHGRRRCRRPQRAQIRQAERHLALGGQIKELQGAEGHQQRLHG